MMMASAYPGHHAGGLQQPGIPHGHPMGPGPGPNPGQPMGQPMQMHPGVSGPNGPHVTQAGPMMGMQPGVGGPGPNAHALSHLTPQAHMFHQQQQQQMQAFVNNPALAMQRQAMLRQQAQQQHMMQQQQNGMAMGFPNGGNQATITPQQMAAMQAGNPQFQVNLPPHMRQQLAQQQQAMQAQHNQAQQHAQQQQQAMAQHMAMQHAASQQSNSGQGPPSQQGSQGPPGQMRPQPPMQPGHEAQASPAQPPSQHHTPQQTQSQPQPPPQPAPTPQQQNPQQPPGPPQQPPPQQQPQNPQHLQQQRQQQHAMAQRQLMQQHQAQAQAQAQAAAQAQAQAQAQNRMYGTTILKLLQLADHLSRYSALRQTNTLEGWKSFVSRFFSEDGVFKQSLLDYAPTMAPTPRPPQPKNFEICYPSIPRYFYTQFQCGVENIQMTIDGAQEKEFGTNCHYVESNRAKFIYWYKNGCQVVSTGKLSATFDQEDKITLLVFETQDHSQYLPRATIDSLFAHKSPMQNQSPKMSKKNAPNQRNRQAPEASLVKDDLPEAPVSTWGVPDPVLQFLEVSETLYNMQELFAHYHSNPGNTPSQAMNSLVASLKPQQTQPGLPPSHLQQHPNPNPQINVPPNAQGNPGNLPPGTRTPSGTMVPGNPNMQPQHPNQHFMSPHIANLQFPGSLNPAVNGSPHLAGQTHTPSPAMAHMAAPGLVAQHSQQGHNSAGQSANTSPSVSNKRRRASVKQETDDGGGDVNGGAAKVKPSPRMASNNKRVKGNPS